MPRYPFAEAFVIQNIAKLVKFFTVKIMCEYPFQEGVLHMPFYTLGGVIRRLRKQKGLSQEELAFMIMDRSNLSNIETGKTFPSKDHLEKIFEKLGYNPNNSIEIYLDERASENQKIINRLDSCLACRDVDGASTLIGLLENDAGFIQEPINVQYIIGAKIANSFHEKVSFEEVRNKLFYAIKIGNPNFNEEAVDDYHLSNLEFRLIKLLAIAYFEMGKRVEAINIFIKLMKNIENNCIDKLEIGRRLPMTISSLTKCLGVIGQYKEAIELCERGRKVCLETGFHSVLPSILMNKACCLYAIGDIESSARLLVRVYYMCDAMEMYLEREIVKKYAKENLGILL